VENAKSAGDSDRSNSCFNSATGILGRCHGEKKAHRRQHRVASGNIKRRDVASEINEEKKASGGSSVGGIRVHKSSIGIVFSYPGMRKLYLRTRKVPKSGEREATGREPYGGTGKGERQLDDGMGVPI
jgi:hypothetical protein